MKTFLILFLVVFTYSLKAQLLIPDSVICNAKKIDMENIKKQSYLRLAKKFNCDSMQTGTTIEELYCTNVEFQKQDSLLHYELYTIINECKTLCDTVRLQEVLLTQELWERYRYAHCISCVIDNTRIDRVLFMKCAIEFTKQRQLDLKKECGY